MYDLVVVGAGPVGSFLAWKFAEKGGDVLLLEKGEVGEPLKCSGHISKELFNFVPYKERFLENEIKGSVFHNNNEKYILGGDRTVSYVIDRAKFDKFLAKKAVEAGTELRKGNFQHFRRGKGKVLISTNKNKYESELLAGCDGPLSNVRTQAGLPDPEEFLHGIFTYTDSLDKMFSESFVDVYLGTTPDFFGWRIPRKGRMEYGLATSLRRSVRKYFERFSKEEGFEMGKIYSGLIPILPAGRTVSERVFLCGDAAGQTKPFTGGGIIYGLTSALIASEVIDPDRPETVWNYEKGWRAKLGKEIWLGDWIRKFYSLPPKLRTPFLKLAEKLPGEKHMDRPSSVFKLCER